MLILPNGPSISTVAPGWFLLTRALWEGRGGSMTRKVTSGGSDSGALPIFDWQLGVVEKREVCCWRCGFGAKAGTRKDGRVTSRVNGVARVSAFARLRDERVQCSVVAIGWDVVDQLCRVADV